MSLPTFTCPKCGAVADLQFRAGATKAELEAALRSLHATTFSSLEWAYRRRQQADQIAEDVERGDRLEASCPRCKHSWQEKPLDAAPSGPTPIYDTLTDEVSPYQPPKSLGFMAWAMGA